MMHSTINPAIQHFADAYSAPVEVTGAIKKASLNTGVDFDYLMNQAKAESSFNPDAEARTSSATGLYQFIESTWLRMVKTHGHKYGLDQEAASIQQNAQTGRLSVSSSNRDAILDLRKDPELASAMAAELAAENKSYLQRNVEGRDIEATEMYFAHFLGARGASDFLNELQANPLGNASQSFPKAAQANRNVFYDPATGQPRTMQQVYDFFDKKFSNEIGSELALPSGGSNADKPNLGQIPFTSTIGLPRINSGSSLFGSFSGLNMDLKTQDELYLSALMALPSPMENDEDNIFNTPKTANDLSLLSNKFKSDSIFTALSNIK
jgi:hypothetical protein